jgi:phenylpropionate dioxygenase-like ring-hydroxylating dioxygenase large terminal subunit
MSTPSVDEIVDRHAEHWRVRRPEDVVLARDLRLSAEQSRIPKQRYLSKDFLARENEQLWTRVWQVVCREESIPDPGDHLPYRIADQEFLVVRQDDGTLKAFYNACLHRGNLVRPTPGSAHELRCPYHGWCWHLDGKLKRIPDRHLTAGVEDAEYGLHEIACESFAGYVFINPAGTAAEPLREFLGPVVDRIAPYRMERQRLSSWHAVELACNWKVGIEAFLEAYHVPGIHPQLVTVLDETNTAYERMGVHHRMWIPYGLPSTRFRDTKPQVVYESWLREHFRERHLDVTGAAGLPDPSTWEPAFDEKGEVIGERNAREFLLERHRAEGRLKGHDYSGLTNEQLIDIDHYMFFPNFVILAKSDDSFILRSRPHATDPDRCTLDVMRLVQVDVRNPEPVASQQWIEANEASYLENLGEVITQDFVNVARVQRGLHARSLQEVTLTANEVRVRWFNDDVDRYIAGDLP